jgi:hypothetical protein
MGIVFIASFAWRAGSPVLGSGRHHRARSERVAGSAGTSLSPDRGERRSGTGAGRGDERASFTDSNIHGPFPVNTTAVIYLSFSIRRARPTYPTIPASCASRSYGSPATRIARKPGRAMPSASARQPAEPLCHGRLGPSRNPYRHPRSRACLAERTAIAVPTRVANDGSPPDPAVRCRDPERRLSPITGAIGSASPGRLKPTLTGSSNLTPPGPNTSHSPSAHSMTSSARARIDCGTVRPSALAVFRLIASSNLVGCSIGRSAGLAPLRILST